MCLLEDGRKVTVLHERDVDTVNFPIIGHEPDPEISATDTIRGE